MKQQHSSLLPKGHIIDEKYSIVFFLKKGDYAESYRVKGPKGKTRFLKLFAYSRLDKTQFDGEGNILEIEILKHVNHPNIVKYFDDGDIVIGGEKYAYVVLDFISGETLADKMKREQQLNIYEAKDLITGLLKGLKYLHNLEDPIIHNDLTNMNIMIDLSGEVPTPKIIDFGYARFLSQSTKDFNKVGLNPYYMAPESYNKVFSVKSDLFSVGALYYHLIFGLPPWSVEISSYRAESTDIETAIENERRKPLKVLDSGANVDTQTINIISKALQIDAANRFSSAEEFTKAIKGKIEVAGISTVEKRAARPIKKARKGAYGFAAIAGMQELKDQMKLEVIDALNEKEKYEEYGLTIPNGMLLYGPPGCGKTFFAERLGEEIGFNFYPIKPSDIQSKWVNASQENVSNLFEEARKNAPTIIFIDELDALVPNRDNASVNHMNTAAVNEFLAQMNNSGEDGIFIIGATNRPTAIDPAILRPGRLDKVIYIPPPDFEARKEMFKIYLEKRPKEIGLDYAELATLTENYVSSDIKFLCDEASRNALKHQCRISMDILKEVISNTRSAIPKAELNRYEKMRGVIEGLKTEQPDRPRIGFKK